VEVNPFATAGTLQLCCSPSPYCRQVCRVQAVYSSLEVLMPEVCVVVAPAGDHGVIAKECARMLGLGTNIPDAAGLPTMDADGKIPKDLGKKYGKMILDADGFAQVSSM